MIENNTLNKLEILRFYMLVNFNTIGILAYTLPIQENKSIKNIEIKDYILYFNSNYIENEKFINIVLNISIKTVQFYFEYNNYEVLYSYVIHIINCYWLEQEKNIKISYKDSLNILANNLKKVNIQKQTIIYYTEKAKQFCKHNDNYDNAIRNLLCNKQLINFFNNININTNINSFIERCQFLFYEPQFTLSEDMKKFFNKYVHNFQHFFLFYFIMRYIFNDLISLNFMRYHKPAFDIINIVLDIDIKNESFKDEELNKKITNFFTNFSLEEKDWYLSLIN